MNIVTKLQLEDQFPLTCSRKGTCCHGMHVNLNPWELACLAQEKGIEKNEFRDLHTLHGGIQLRFNGEEGWQNKPSCNQYIPNFGCSVHKGRPLACRLFPLGRQTQNDEKSYIHQGRTFPCLDACSEVLQLPQMSVAEYIVDQATEPFELAQDLYLEIMQNMADMAFELLLETGLAASGDVLTLAQWRIAGTRSTNEAAQTLETTWLNLIMLPALSNKVEDLTEFAIEHNELIQRTAQENFGALNTFDEIHKASCLMMHMALYLARGLGADPKDLSERWIAIAKEHGALE